jgi:LemA protein
MDLAQIATLAFATVIAFWMLGAYNRLVRLRNDIGAAFAQVDSQLQRRAAVLPGLLADLREPLASEAGALDACDSAQAGVCDAADAMRARPARPGGAEALAAALARLDSALVRLVALSETNAPLREVDGVAAALAVLRDVDARLGFARQLHNEAVRAYNDALAEFPTRLLVPMYRFVPAGRL